MLMDRGAPDELVLHYKGVNRLLGSPKRLNAAIAVSGGIAFALLVAALVIHNSSVDYAAVWIGGFAALAAVLFVYSRLRFAYAGLYLSGGRVGVMGTLGGRTGVDASQVDHFQLCTLAPTGSRAYGVILLVGQSGTWLLRLNVVELIPPDGLQELSRRSGIPIQGSLD